MVERRIAYVLLAASLLGCASAPSTDAGLPLDAGASDVGPPTPVHDVDLLFVIDDTASFRDQQPRVAAVVPTILAAITSGGGGTFPAPDSLHVGFVSPDTGVDVLAGVGNCTATGDDGVLLVREQTMPAGCMADYAPRYPDRVLAWIGGDANAIGTDAACIAQLGHDGCNVPFVLDAMLKALSPAPTADGSSPVTWTADGYRPPTFLSGQGHGVDPSTNGAFLRADSLLVIVDFTDADDESTGETAIYSPTDPRYSSADLDTRSIVFADHLYPLARYVDGLVGLRRDPRHLVYVFVGGIPVDLAGHPVDEVLADARVQAVVDPMNPPMRALACRFPTTGGAYASRRLLGVGVGLAAAGAAVSVGSICDSDTSHWTDAVLAPIRAALSVR